MLKRFSSECELLSRLHHPCIVQFLGICFESGSQLPVMVMELLHTTLSSLIDDYGILPEEISYNVFRDVALGLRYLHEQSPCIVHRDLSANNILLSKEMNAKISDVGVAKILNLSHSKTQTTHTQTPSTPCYMPPEAIVAHPKYTSKVDIFSYGVLMVHMLSGKWPIPGSVFRVDPSNPGAMIPLSEIERREENFQAIRPDHPLMDLIRRCLSNSPDPRPEAAEILCHIDAVREDLPPTYKNKLEMMRQHKSHDTNGEVAALRREIEIKRREGEAQQREIGAQKYTIDAQRKEIETKRNEIDAKTREVEAQRRENEQQRSEVRSMRRENQLLREQLEMQGIPIPKPTTTEPPPPIHLAQMQWKRVADLPVVMSASQITLFRGNAYVGGGSTSTEDDSMYKVFWYNAAIDCWNSLPRCLFVLFALGEFQGDLITVGGVGGHGLGGYSSTGSVYRYIEREQQWEEHLPPMPTARCRVSIFTTKSAIIACGGYLELDHVCEVVEVYTAVSGQWHIADALPSPCRYMISVTVGDNGYLLDFSGPETRVYGILLPSLVEKATATTYRQQLPKSSEDSLWKPLTRPPRVNFGCSAVNFGGHLLALSGADNGEISLEARVFCPSTNTWSRLPSFDLPNGAVRSASIQISPTQLLICGGIDSTTKNMSRVLMGTATDQ